jgi:hypothetical protein
MKVIRLYCFPVIAAVFFAALVTVSCDLPAFNDPDDPEVIPEGEGVLLITLPGNGASGTNRSVLPNGLLGSLEYTLTFTKGAEVKTVPEMTGGTCTINLAAGTWTVEANACDPSDTLVGTGSTTATVTAGQRVHAAILMEPAGFYAENIYIHNDAELRKYIADYDDYDDPGITFHLENDISVNGSPAGDLWGTLDGHGHTVTLNINVTGGQAGLLETNYGTVKNLRLVGTVSGIPSYAYLNAGAVSGSNNGTIRNVSSAVTVTAVNTYTGTGGLTAGGITGGNSGTIEDCSVSGNVVGNRDAGTGDPNAGGIVGKNGSEGIVNRCYAYGNVSSDDGSGTVGGIVGFNSGVISNCAALNSKVYNSSTNINWQHRIAGCDYNNGGTFINNHAYGDMQIGDPSLSSYITGTSTDGDGEPITAATLSSSSDILWAVSGMLNWPPFQTSPASEPPNDTSSPWYWSNTITIPGNDVNSTGVPAAYVPVLWFE